MIKRDRLPYQARWMKEKRSVRVVYNKRVLWFENCIFTPLWCSPRCKSLKIICMWFFWFFDYYRHGFFDFFLTFWFSCWFFTDFLLIFGCFFDFFWFWRKGVRDFFGVRNERCDMTQPWKALCRCDYTCLLKKNQNTFAHNQCHK